MFISLETQVYMLHDVITESEMRLMKSKSINALQVGISRTSSLLQGYFNQNCILLWKCKAYNNLAFHPKIQIN